MNPLPVDETDLHAYVDEQLPEGRRAPVEAFLSDHPDEAERIRAYRAQNAALRALFNPVLDEPLPTGLTRLASPPRRPVMQRLGGIFLHPRSLQRLAASILVMVASGYAGWLAHDRYRPAETVVAIRSLPQQAAVAHVVYTPEVRHPVEVQGDQEDQLVTWLSRRLGTPMHAPKLANLGYELVGGRLLTGNTGPVALFMYQDGAGRRLTLYVSTEYSGMKETAFRFAQEGSVNVFYWVDGQCGYALSGSIEKAELARVSSAVYDQFEQG